MFTDLERFSFLGSITISPGKMEEFMDRRITVYSSSFPIGGESEPVDLSVRMLLFYSSSKVTSALPDSCIVIFA